MTGADREEGPKDAGRRKPGSAEGAREDHERARPAGDLPPGTRVGVYRLEGVIGRGGLGTVYAARRSDGAFQQDVAVKVLGVGPGSEMGRRFQVERELLAALQHPNLARVMDGGALPDGRPFLVMERIRGSPITEYCRREDLDLRGRLRIFLEVARAVQYAHRHLVVHRDLKPANILVNEDGAVKLVDFGLAKLLDDDLVAGAVRRTRSHFRLLTPEYAAPEQLRGEAITTATDVYQLGLLLQELLTGRQPRAAEADSPGELERIASREEARRPSSDAPSRRLRWALRGDLDAIALKALRTDPARRYASAGELADDVDRFLAGRPVKAEPDRLGHRLRDTVKRRPVAAAVAACLVGFIGLQLVTATMYAGRMSAERDAAAQEAARAEEVKEFIVGLLVANEPVGPEGEGPDALELARDGRDRLDELRSQPEVYSTVLATLTNVFDAWGEVPELRPEVEVALELHDRDRGVDHPDLAEALYSMGTVEFNQGNHEEAERLYREAEEMRIRIFGNEHPEVAASLHARGRVEAERGEREAAAALYEEALGILRQELPEGRRDWRGFNGIVLHDLAVTRRHLGDLEGADSLHAEAVEVRREHLGEHHPRVATAYSSWSRTLREMEAWRRAVEPLAEAVALESASPAGSDLRLANRLRTLAQLHERLGSPEEAVELHRRSLELRLRDDGRVSERARRAYEGLGSALRTAGRTEEAREAFREALAIHEALGEGDDGDLLTRASILNGLVLVEISDGEAEAAEAYLDRSEALVSGMEERPGVYDAAHHGLRGKILLEGGHLREARRALAAAYPAIVEYYGIDHPVAQDFIRSLRTVHRRLGDPSEGAEGAASSVARAPG